MRKIELSPWWAELVALKDVLSLRELAERFPVTPGAIANALKRNGIERQAAPSGPRDRRPARELPDLPPVLEEVPEVLPPPADEARTEEVAPEKTGRKISKISPFAGLLGTVPDHVVAQKAGVTPNAVCLYRHRMGIAAFGKTDAPPAEPVVTSTPKPVVEAVVAPVVEVPAPLAELPETYVAVAVQPASATPLFGYMATISGKSFLIVGRDIVAAVQVAMDAKLGTVERIDLVGPAL